MSWVHKIIPYTLFSLLFAFSGSVKGNNDPLHGINFPALHKSLQTLYEDRTLEQIPKDYFTDLINPGYEPEGSVGPTLTSVDWLRDFEVDDHPELRNQFEKAILNLQNTGKFFSRLDGSNILQVPFGITDDLNGVEYYIGFDNLKLYPTHATLDIIAGLKLPGLNQMLLFGANEIQYSNQSGFFGNVKLALISDFSFEVHKNHSALVFRGYRPATQQGSYIVIDCDGVREIQLGVHAVFNPGMIQPVNQNQNYVNAYSEIKIDSENGFLVEDLSFDPFYFNGFNKVAFQVQKMALDLSETESTIPYLDKYINNIKSQSGESISFSKPQWTGFYCQEMEIILGEEFIQKNVGERISISAENLIIDELGFSSFVTVERQLVDINEGSIGGWGISVNGFNLDILANTIYGYGFNGFIKVPLVEPQSTDGYPVTSVNNQINPTNIESETSENNQQPLSETSCLPYSSTYYPDAQKLVLTVEYLDQKELGIPVLFADLNIEPGSEITVEITEEVKIQALLNCNIQLNGNLNSDNSNSKLKDVGVRIKGLLISNQAPFLEFESIQPMSKTECQLGNINFDFKTITLQDFEPEKNNQQVKKLSFEEIGLSIGNAVDGDNFSINTSMDIFFSLSSVGKRQQWKSEGMRIREAEIEGTLPGIEYIHGYVVFHHDHEEYGNGFAGLGSVKFNFSEALFGMECMFGEKEEIKYSYVDVSMSNQTGSTSENFQIHTLVGGYFKNMRREQLTGFTISEKEKAARAYDVELGGRYPENRYIPAANGMGFHGGLVAIIGKAAIVGARIEYETYPTENGQGNYSRFFFEGLIEIQPEDVNNTESVGAGMNTSGSSSSTGEGETVSVNTGPAPEFQGSGKLGGYVRILVIKDGELRTLNAALGVHGKVSSYGLAFYGEYYKSGEDWHLFIGKPDMRMKITYEKKIEHQKQSSGYGLMITGYYMVGNSPYMPTRPPPPYSENEDRHYLLMKAYNMASNLGSKQNIFGASAVNEGRAITFGAQFGMDVWLEYGPLAVDAGADIGFDVLLSQNVPDCNMDFQGEEPGINGWYLNGQFYAAVAAKLGLRFGKKLFEIFNAGVALVVQAGAFNPTAGVGAWVVKYKILFIKGEAEGVFKFGNPCGNGTLSFDPEELVYSMDATNKIEAPIDEPQNCVSVSSNFKIGLSMSANRNVDEQLVDFETGSSERIRVFVETQADINYTDGSPIEYNLTYQDDNTVLLLAPKQMLIPGKEIAFNLSYNIRDRNTGGPFTFEDKTFSKDTTVLFTVDEAGILGLSNQDITLSYPTIDQEYFHTEEYPDIMIDYGKEIPGAVQFTSTLLEKKDGTFQEVNSAPINQEAGAFIQPVFPECTTSKAYQWRLTMDYEGQSAHIASVDFFTSQYATFKEKIKNIQLASVNVAERTPSGAFEVAVADGFEDFEYPESGLTQLHTTWIGIGRYDYLFLVNKIMPFGKYLTLKCPPSGKSGTGSGKFGLNDEDVVEHNYDTGENSENNQYEDRSFKVDPFVQWPLAHNGTAYEYNIDPYLFDAYQDLNAQIKQVSFQCAGHPVIFPFTMNIGMYPIQAKYYIPAFKKYTTQEGILEFNVFNDAAN